jgi:hypothetical protein
MSDARLKNLAALWVVVLGFAVIVTAQAEDEHRRTAARLDLKVMTLELKGQSAVIDRMGRWRNAERARANAWENVVLRLAAAAVLAAVSTQAVGFTAWAILMFSLGQGVRALVMADRLSVGAFDATMEQIARAFVLLARLIAEAA